MSYRTIVVATDGSEAGDRAVSTARSLAGEVQSRLVVVHINEVVAGRLAHHPIHPNEQAVQEKIRDQVHRLKLDGVETELRVHRVARGHPARPIADDAKATKADLIVAGTTRRGRLAGLFFGGVTQELIRIASCPVLTVPRPARQG